MTAFKVQLPLYHGPIDLLLELVRAHELKILDIELADIASAFVGHLSEFGPRVLEEAGDFIVALSTLLEFKSRELIPRPMAEETAETADEARTELVRQLLEYRRFKEAASLLSERATVRRRKFARGTTEFAVVDPSQQPIREVELWDLVSAFSRLMRENIVPIADEIPKDPTPLPVHMDRMEAAVHAAGAGGLSFAQLFGTRNTKVQLIGKFLALLELIKTSRVWLEWDPATQEISILPPNKSNATRIDPTGVMADETTPPEFHSTPATPLSSHEIAMSLKDDAVDLDAEKQSRGSSDPPERKSAWEDFEPLVD